MKRWSIFFLLLTLATAGCSSNPRHMSGDKFERSYEVGKVQTLDGYSYVGETNGAVYMLRKRVPLFGSKPKEQVVFTETNRLTPGFLQEMRNESKVEKKWRRIGNL